MAMKVMIASLYDALKSVGASEEQAQLAASDVANYERDIARIDGSLLLLKWMVGFNLAFTLAVVWKVFS